MTGITFFRHIQSQKITNARSFNSLLEQKNQNGLNRKVIIGYIATYSSNEFADSHRMSDPIMSDFKFTSNGIEKLMKGLNAHKTPGPDNLSPRLLKELSSEIAPLLQLVYQKSLDTSCVPEEWRKAKVTPIYKKGPKFLAENYHPVSLTSVYCKIMEHVLASNIM